MRAAWERGGLCHGSPCESMPSDTPKPLLPGSHLRRVRSLFPVFRTRQRLENPPVKGAVHRFGDPALHRPLRRRPPSRPQRRHQERPSLRLPGRSTWNYTSTMPPLRTRARAAAAHGCKGERVTGAVARGAAPRPALGRNSIWEYFWMASATDPASASVRTTSG